MSKVLANVGGFPITEDDVNEFLLRLGQRGQSYNNPEGRKVILEQLVGNKLLLLDAKRNLFEAEPAFKAELAKLKDNLLTNYAGEKIVSAVNVTDAEAKEYYEANKDNILVDTEEKALELLAKINAGEISFEDAAKENSSCPSGQNGGSLGEFGRGQMVPEFDKAVFEMEVGTVSAAPVKTQFGYHLIKLNSKKAAEPMAYEQISEEIKNGLLGEKRQKAYESKINQLKILYPVDFML